MAGPSSRPSMNTVAPMRMSRSIRLIHTDGERAVLPVARHGNGDEYVAGTMTKDRVHGWPGQRPGHDESIMGRVGLLGQISREYPLCAGTFHQTAVRLHGNDT